MLKNQILFVMLMAAGTAVTTSTMKASYQSATVGSCMKDEYISYDSDDSDWNDPEFAEIPTIVKWFCWGVFGVELACETALGIKSYTWDAKPFGINHGGKALVVATAAAAVLGLYLVKNSYKSTLALDPKMYPNFVQDYSVEQLAQWQKDFPDFFKGYSVETLQKWQKDLKQEESKLKHNIRVATRWNCKDDLVKFEKSYSTTSWLLTRINEELAKRQTAQK